MKGHHILRAVLISGEKCLLIGLSNALMVIFFQSGIDFSGINIFYLEDYKRFLLNP